MNRREAIKRISSVCLSLGGIGLMAPCASAQPVPKYYTSTVDIPYSSVYSSGYYSCTPGYYYSGSPYSSQYCIYSPGYYHGYYSFFSYSSYYYPGYYSCFVQYFTYFYYSQTYSSCTYPYMSNYTSTYTSNYTSTYTSKFKLEGVLQLLLLDK